eukprot:735675-Hanusia_phi.AAC.1
MDPGGGPTRGGSGPPDQERRAAGPGPPGPGHSAATQLAESGPGPRILSLAARRVAAAQKAADSDTSAGCRALRQPLSPRPADSEPGGGYYRIRFNA